MFMWKFSSLSFVAAEFLRVSFSFLSRLYLYFPKLRILQTGGLAAGLTSTRSRPRLRASVMASAMPMTPRDLLSSSTMTRTSRARILLFARMKDLLMEIMPLGLWVQELTANMQGDHS